MSNNSIYYIVYQTTNQVNGKIYIGAHKTTDLDDGYIGSGKYLRRSIDKHGVENFTREILFLFDNREEMYQKEKELVNEEFLERDDVYNLTIGGKGGFDHIDDTTRSLQQRVMISKCIEKYGPEWRKLFINKEQCSKNTDMNYLFWYPA